MSTTYSKRHLVSDHMIKDAHGNEVLLIKTFADESGIWYHAVPQISISPTLELYSYKACKLYAEVVKCTLFDAGY